MKGFMSLLGKSGTDDFNRRKHFEPKIDRKSQKRINTPCPAAASYRSAQVKKIKRADF